jgi:hypothetical protein
MAWDRTYVTLVFRDSKGRDKRKIVEMVTNDPATSETAAASIAAAFQAVTKGAIVKYTVSGENVVAATPDAGSNVDAGMTATCQLAGRDKKAVLRWPMPTEAILQSDGSLLLTDTDVLAIEDLFQSGGVAKLSDGELIDSILTGKLDK